MTPAWVMLARLDGLIARLEQAQAAIAAQGQNTRLKKRIGDDLSRRLSEQTGALRARRSKIDPAGEVPSHLWSELQEPSEATSLLNESLLYLQAAHSRGPDSDADLSEITDALFEELGGKANSVSWKSFSVFSVEDSFDVLKQIVRVRYPMSGVWDIPVAAHEFGHFLSGRLRDQKRDGSASLIFEQYKSSFKPKAAGQPAPGGDASANIGASSTGTGVDRSAWLDEMFADVFAAYAAGPCFACSCLLFRFDPSSAQAQKDSTHPSEARRAYVILTTLRTRDNEPPHPGSLRPIINLLESSWSSACKAAGTSAEVSDEDAKWIGSQISNLYQMLKTNEGGLRFDEWAGAENKVPWLEEIPQKGPQDFTVIELLNAAWLGRLKENSDPDRLSENFVTLARRKTESYDR
jgi:hypothetical protein